MKESLHDRQLRIMDATMEIVAESGLEGMSMRTLCSRTELSAPLVYAIFPSKEDLLYQCFLCVNRQIEELFQDASLSADSTPDQVLAFIHDMWVRYFHFMVKNGSRTMYYYAYRDSANIQNVLMSNNQTVAQDMAAYCTIFNIVAEKLGIFRKLPPEHFHVFLLDGTGNFVRRIIRQGIAYTDQDVETIWQLLTGGFLSFFG